MMREAQMHSILQTLKRVLCLQSDLIFTQDVVYIRSDVMDVSLSRYYTPCILHAGQEFRRSKAKLAINSIFLCENATLFLRSLE